MSNNLSSSVASVFGGCTSNFSHVNRSSSNSSNNSPVGGQIFQKRGNNASPNSSLVTVPRVISLYILPLPAGNADVSIPGAASKLKKLLDAHGCYFDLKNQNSHMYPTWTQVNDSIRSALDNRKALILNELGDNGVYLLHLLNGPFYVGHHAQSAGVNKVIEMPTEKDPQFPVCNISQLNEKSFGFRIPGNDKVSEICVVLLHKDWKSTFLYRNNTKAIGEMWDVCNKVRKSSVGQNMSLCSRNCGYLDVPDNGESKASGEGHVTAFSMQDNGNKFERNDLAKNKIHEVTW